MLATNWGTKNKDTVPHVYTMVSNFDRTALWVANEIVTRKRLDHRASIVEHFINIAYESLLINNYSSSYAVFSGLSQPSVARLSDTWAVCVTHLFSL